ncbi:SIMPL domain-containing protein [Blastococcus brunescens]|uniref:SIMPL domain-containing protein n=1 Tax=Blastococcus brunescens TaxID=1564165 RepID=A0ABZ1B632_9ACTN|nr:SIMPL domain-containing protein [Blastococcus sp. BMG 8361]WRL65161.1 SIMPL domain-containing protein [Blastococcus sp. BMG 8361]
MSSSVPQFPAIEAGSPQVVVRGEAVLQVEPELADVWVTVRVRARDRQTALERCQAAQERVSAAARAAGDAVESVETTAVSVHLEIRDRRAPGEPVATVSTRLTVVRLDAVGDLVVTLGRLDDVDVSGPPGGCGPTAPPWNGPGSTP